MSELYDVIIVGAGPAGLAAGIYTGRDRLKTVILDKMIPGGQINNTDRIENYPGFVQISGPELIKQFEEQVKKFGAEVRQLSEATKIVRGTDGLLNVEINHQEVISGRAVILSPGSDYRKLGVPGEDKFRESGGGVSYCGTCDGPFFKDKVVVAVGGGNTACEEAAHLTKFAKKVYLIHRRDQFRAQKILQEEVFQKVEEGKIELVLDTVVTSIEGDSKVRYVKTKNVKTGEEGKIDCDGVFIFVGMIPNTKFLEGFVELDESGFIKCEPIYLKTNVPGVFAAGDCRVGAMKQVVTSCADGVIAAMSLKYYFQDPDWWYST